MEATLYEGHMEKCVIGGKQENVMVEGDHIISRLIHFNAPEPVSCPSLATPQSSDGFALRNGSSHCWLMTSK
jgi:hypothetical protein